MFKNPLLCPVLACVLAATIVFVGQSKADTIFVTGYDSNQVLQFASDGSSTPFATSPLNGANGIALDGSGDVFVSNAADNTISKFTSNGTGSIFAPATPQSFFYQGLIFDSTGNLYAGNGDEYVEKFTPDGTSSVFADLGAGNSATAFAFNGAGDLFVSDENEGNIFEVLPNGTVSLFTHVDGASFFGLAINSSGDLFAADYNDGNNGDGKIWEFSSNGTGSLFASGLSSPTGLAFESNGDLLEADYASNTIYSFTPNGTQSVFASTGSTGSSFGPSFIAVAPIPEPSGFAMVGLGVVSLVLGSRRRV
jgi:hypothetical protein